MLFNGKYWHKPGHLGMTTAEVKEALQNGASLPEIAPEDVGKALVINADGEIVIQEDFVIHVTQSGADFVCDASPNQITEAVNNGQRICLNILGLLEYKNPLYAQSIQAQVYTLSGFMLLSSAIYPDGVIYVSTGFTPSDLDLPMTLDVHFIPFAP